MVWETLGGESLSSSLTDLFQVGFFLLPVIPRCLELLLKLTELGLQTLSSFPGSILYQLMAQRRGRLGHSHELVQQLRVRVCGKRADVMVQVKRLSK